MGLVLLLVFLVSILTAFPSVSFSAASLDRQASVNVVDDIDGIVGLNRSTALVTSKKNDPSRPLVDIENSVGSDVTVTVTTSSPDGITAQLFVNDTPVNSGEPFQISAEGSKNVEVKADSKGTLNYSISVEGEGVSASMTRTVEVYNNVNNVPGSTTQEPPQCDNNPGNPNC
ncbi:hypothetical protein [Halomarina rubra]|uniref:Uncharacterized protein n=1 Tax=Halomarina rubra TaxID=2071873 RepID=A0ABD6B1Q1_9EURY|nr:hypothetical protein [Halomarina rubra]